MILSSLSATSSDKGDAHNAKKYATWSALVSVLAFVILFGFMAYKTASWMSITLVLSMLLLYTTMILSAIASSSSSSISSGSKDSHNYAVYSSVLTGVTIAMIILFFILYVNKEKVSQLADQGYDYAKAQIGAAQDYFGNM